MVYYSLACSFNYQRDNSTGTTSSEATPTITTPDATTSATTIPETTSTTTDLTKSIPTMASKILFVLNVYYFYHILYHTDVSTYLSQPQRLPPA